nr:MAG TPA: Cytosine specific methyltransferase [Caudoviricetes sp.]
MTLFPICLEPQEENTQNTLYGKTSWEHFQAIKDVTFKPCLAKSHKPIFQCLDLDDGQEAEWYEVRDVTSHGASLTLNIGASPSIERESSLLRVLEIGGGRPEVLFESESMPGNPEESQGKKETITRTAVSSTETSVYDIGNGQINSIRMREKAGALNCMHDQRCVLVKTYRIGSYESEGMKSNNPTAGIKEVDKSNTLDLSGSNPARNQGGICISVLDMTHAQDVIRERNDGTVQTLNNRMGTGGNQVPIIYTFNRDASVKNNMPVYEDKTSTLKPSTRLAVVYAIDCRNSRLSQISMTLQAKNQGGYSLNYQNPIIVKNYVRRLMPLECERLQGLPDNWTEGGSDTARYRAIGNGMAQPCADYVMSKVVEDIKEET